MVHKTTYVESRQTLPDRNKSYAIGIKRAIPGILASPTNPCGSEGHPVYAVGTIRA